MARVVFVVSSVALAASLAVLAGVGFVVWRRTAPVRRGHSRSIARAERSPRGRSPPARDFDEPRPGGRNDRTSWTTCAAAVGGAAVAGAAAATAGASSRLAGVALAVLGVATAVSGLVGRMTGVRSDGDGLVVRRAVGRPVEMPWDEVVEVRPPRSPLGAWRLETATRRCSLMASDLLGHEDVLDEAIARAELRFDGRRWRRPGVR